MFPKVVIVDHRQSSRQVLRQLFEQAWGWPVVGEAADSAEAVAVVRLTQPDVIIVDSNPADAGLNDLANLVAPLGAPVLVGLVDFPHETASTGGPSVLKGVPTDHIRQVILNSLAEAHPETWASAAGDVPISPVPASELSGSGATAMGAGFTPMAPAPTGPSSMGTTAIGTPVPPPPAAAPARRAADDEEARVGFFSSLLGADEDDADFMEAAPSRTAPPPPPAVPLAEPPRAEPALAGAARGPISYGAPVPVAAPALPAPPAQPASEPANLLPSLEEVTSESSDIRRQAVQRLASTAPSEESLSLAAMTVGDPDVEIRHLSLAAFERAPHLAPVHALAQAALDPDTSIRARALNVMGRSGRPDHVAVLSRRAMSEQESVVKGAALSGLAGLLGEVPTSDIDPLTLSAVCSAFGNLGPDLTGRYGREMRTVAGALGAPALLARLGDADPQVAAGATALYHCLPGSALAEGTDGAPGDGASFESHADTAASGPTAAELAAAQAAALAEGAIPQSATVPSAPQATTEEAVITPEPVMHSESPPPFEAQPAAETPAPPATTLRPWEPSGPSAGAHDAEMMATANELAFATLVDALADPDASVRQGAAEALGMMPVGQINSWVTERFRTNDPRAVTYAERLAPYVNLDDAAADLAEALVTMPAGPQRDSLARVLTSLPSTDRVIEQWLASNEGAVRGMAIELAGLTGGLSAASLSKALADPMAGVRQTAISAIRGPLGIEQARALIQVVQSDTSAVVAASAAHALAGAPSVTRAAAAEACLRHRDRQVRLAGVGLVPVDDEGSTVLLDLLSDDDVEVAEAAAEALVAFPATEVVLIVWPSLRTASGPVAERMITLLQKVDRRMTERLARTAAEGQDVRDRVIGLQVLVRIGADGVGERLGRALSDPSREVRLTAVQALADQPGLVRIEELGARTRDPDAEIRRATVQALMVTNDDRGLVHLLDAARDPVADVRGPARQFLQTHCATTSPDLLVRALSDPALRSVAAELLEQTPEAATELIIRELPDVDAETRAAMGRVLSSPSAVDLLIRGLTHPDPARRMVALQGLALARQPASAPALAACLEDPDPGIRTEASRVVGSLGDPSVTPALRRVLATDPDMAVVAAAEEALRRLTQIQTEARGGLPEEQL